MKQLFYLFVVSMGLFEANASSVDLLATTEKFTKVTLVIAEPVNRAESKFGHGFLRLSHGEQDTIKDVAIEFAAKVDGKINYIRGLGIGKRYDFDIHPRSYQDLYTSNIQIQERNLYQYELDLTQAEVDNLVNYIKTYNDRPEKDKYNFLFGNCSSKIAESLNLVLDGRAKLKGYKKNVPIELPKILKEKNLIRKEFVTKSIKTIRGDIVKKFFDSNIEVNHTYLFNLKDQLLGEPQARLIGYVKLRNLADMYPEKEEILVSLIRRLAANETNAIKLNAMRIAGGAFKDIVKLSSMEKSSNAKYKISFNIKKEIQKGSFDVQTLDINGKPEFQLSVKHSCSNKINECQTDHFRFTHSELRFANNRKIVEIFGRPVDYLGGISQLQNDISSKVLFIPEFVKDDLHLIILQENVNVNNNLSFNITNFKTKENPFGVCVGLTMLQKKLMANIFFRPQEKQKSEAYYTEMFTRAAQGTLVLVDGVGSIEQMAELIPKEKIKSIALSLNKKNNQLLTAMTGWARRRNLTQKQMEDIQYLANKGFPTLVVFRPTNKMSVNHLLLIHSVKDEGDYYRLGVYDSNLGFISDHYSIYFKMKKATMAIESNFYKNAPADFAAEIF